MTYVSTLCEQNTSRVFRGVVAGGVLIYTANRSSALASLSVTTA